MTRVAIAVLLPVLIAPTLAGLGSDGYREMQRIYLGIVSLGVTGLGFALSGRNPAS
jgi:hypothetical protein